MSAAILTVDIGTSRTRARLFHLDGSTLDEASCSSSTESPFPGAVELDCEALWQDVSTTVASVCRAGPDIVAMGVTAQLGVALLNHAGALFRKGDTLGRHARPRRGSRTCSCARRGRTDDQRQADGA